MVSGDPGNDMPDLEQRVGDLETRVDQLAIDAAHATNLGATATREALTAREAHQRNIALLNALRETQAEHSRMHAEHSRRFDAIDGTLGQLTLGMHTIDGLLRRLIDEG